MVHFKLISASFISNEKMRLQINIFKEKLKSNNNLNRWTSNNLRDQVWEKFAEIKAELSIENLKKKQLMFVVVRIETMNSLTFVFVHTAILIFLAR